MFVVSVVTTRSNSISSTNPGTNIKWWEIWSFQKQEASTRQHKLWKIVAISSNSTRNIVTVDISVLVNLLLESGYCSFTVQVFDARTIIAESTYKTKLRYRFLFAFSLQQMGSHKEWVTFIHKRSSKVHWSKNTLAIPGGTLHREDLCHWQISPCPSPNFL